MGFENCLLVCPAVVEANAQIAGSDGRLAAANGREVGRQAAAAQWGVDVSQAIDDGTWTRGLQRRHSGFCGYSAIAEQTNNGVIKQATAAKEGLVSQVDERVSHCTKGPRVGWLGSGIGATVCRSTVRDDGLPNKG